MSEPPIEFPITAQDRFSRVFAALKRDMTDTRDLTRGIGAAVATAQVPLLALAAAGGGAALAIQRIADGLDNLNDAADATGSAINRFAALDRLARQNNESTELVTNSLLKLNKALADAKGDSPLARQLQAIGLDIKQLRELDPADALQAVARALAGYADDGDRARVVQQIFGKSTKEVAGFLKDLAAASDLGSVAIARQAAEAERFNKSLAQLQVELTDVGRAIGGAVLPALNEMFVRVRTLREVYGSLGAGLLENLGAKKFRDAGDGVAFYTKEVRRLESDVQRLRRGGSVFDSLNAETAAKDLDKATRALQFYRKTYAALAQDLGQTDPRELARRGRPTAALPTIPVVEETDKPKERKVSEAERYLESLRNQAEQLLELTSTERVLRDIQFGRLEGLNPRLEAEIRSTAQRIDLQRQLNAEVKREADLQKLLADRAQGDINTTLGRLDATPTGQAERRAVEVERLLEFSRRLAETDPQQQKVLEALQQIRREAEAAATELEGLGKTGKTEFEKLQEAVDGFANNSIEALLDFAETGEASFSNLFKAFRRDLLRELIEDPVRDTMRNVVKLIKDELGKLDGENNPLAKLFAFIKSIGSSGSGDGGGLGDIASLIGNFFGGRSMGGDTRQGRMYRWRENGAEYFVPQENGTVITQAQLRGMGGATVDARTTIVVQGDASGQALAAMRRMLDERDARLIRSLQHGRLRSA